MIFSIIAIKKIDQLLVSVTGKLPLQKYCNSLRYIITQHSPHTNHKNPVVSMIATTLPGTVCLVKQVLTHTHYTHAQEQNKQRPALTRFSDVYDLQDLPF